MEAPKCKICHERHFGLCRSISGDLLDSRGPVPHQPVRWPPHDLAPPKPKKKSAQRGQHTAADGEVGVTVPRAPTKPRKAGLVSQVPMPRSRDKVLLAAEEAAAFAKTVGDIRTAGPRTPEREAAELHVILYRPDGTINEAAARAGHNAYMTLLMRKRRAAKKAETP